MIRPPAGNVPRTKVAAMFPRLDTARPPMRPRRLSWAACCAAVALSSCSLGPRYHRPEVPPPDHWATAADPAAAQWPSADWWRGFDSAELDAFIAEAQRANDDLRAAVARVQQADAQRRIAGAPLLPSLEVSAQATRARAPTPPNGAYLIGNNFSPLLAASYQIDFFGKN